jgi:transitional endoplasmic reticulum ATPase
MFDESAFKEIVTEQYTKERKRAEKQYKNGNRAAAARHYRAAASRLTELADLERNGELEKRHRANAERYRSWAEKLEREPQPRQSGSASSDGESGSGRGALRTTGESTEATEGDETVEAARLLEAPPALTFDDVGGMHDLKQLLIERVVDPLERKELYEEYDLGVVNGILLYGPPGTGKTFIARALAGKLGYNFMNVTTADVVSKYVGEAAQNVRDVFAVAKANQPCMVFFDEFDAVASDRGGDMSNSEKGMVNQFLQSLTDVQGEDVVVVAATNYLALLDSAVKRSGRFDERIEVPPPDADARVEIMKIHLRNRPVLLKEVDWERVAALTDGYSGSDIELVAENAARLALKERLERDETVYISQTHIEAAIGETPPTIEYDAGDGGDAGEGVA